MGVGTGEWMNQRDAWAPHGAEMGVMVRVDTVIWQYPLDAPRWIMR